jgi:hypothetical protein
MAFFRSMLFGVAVSAGLLIQPFGEATAQPLCRPSPTKADIRRDPDCRRWQCMRRSKCLVRPNVMSLRPRCVVWACTVKGRPIIPPRR